jgi:MSHA biogenesis protein MshL
MAAEDAAPLPLPTPATPPAPSTAEVKAVPAEVPPPASERPKIRRWLEEPPAAPAPVAPDATSSDVPPPHVLTGPEPLVGTDPELQLEDPSVTARRAALHEDIKLKLEEARHEYKAGNYQHAENIARNVLSCDPRNVSAAEMIRKARGKLLDADERVTSVASERRDREALLETDESAVRPPPRIPTVRPHLQRRDEDIESARHKTMSQKLEQRVSFDFMKADLEWVLNSLFILTGVNIIADQAALEGKSLTLHVEDLPLREVLNFIVRNNTGIQYSVTEDAVWITATEKDDLKNIMYPKVYALHHGLVSTEGGGGAGSGQRSGSTGRGGSGGGSGGGGGGRGGGRGGGGGGGANKQQAGGKQGTEEPTYIETVLKWMKDVKDAHVFPEGSDYLIDRQSNQLVVFTTPAGHERITQFLDFFDQPAIQVLIKSRFLNISATNEKSLGANLDRLNTRFGSINTTGTDTGTSTSISTDNPPGGQTNPFRRFSYTGGTGPINFPGTLGPGNVLTLIGRRTDPQFQITVAALLNSSFTKVLSEPQVLAINNKQAVIDISTQFSYITNLTPVQSTTAVGNGTAVQNVSAFIPEFDTEEIGFTLTVTPSVGRDLKTINMHIEPIIDSLSSGQQVQDFQTFDLGTNNTTQPAVRRPTIDQTSVVTDIVMEDNGYVILGGLMQNRKDVIERKVPGLHKIPVLGNLFKSTSTNTTKSNLLIIVEAQIIAPSGRTYYSDPAPDAVNPREGGTNRAPMQISDATRPSAINQALGLPPKPVLQQPVSPADAHETPDLRDTRKAPNAPSAPRTAPAVAAAPERAPQKAKTAQLSPREQMEQIARTSRNSAAVAAVRADWSVAEEEGLPEKANDEKPVETPAQDKSATRGEVISPEK